MKADNRDLFGDSDDADEDRPVLVSTGVNSQLQQDGFSDMLRVVPISIGIAYLFLVLLFRSLLTPFIVLLSLPFAVSGAFIALAATQRPLGISSLIGMLALIGIVVTNAVVLLDFVKQLQERGMDVRAALIEGGRLRVRPILMTALATGIALIPLAIGLTEGALIASELATTVIGGLITSTALTLVVVPVLYSLLGDARGDDEPGEAPDWDGGGGGSGDVPPSDEPRYRTPSPFVPPPPPSPSGPSGPAGAEEESESDDVGDPDDNERRSDSFWG